MSVVLHWSLEDRRDSEHNNARELDDNKDDNNHDDPDYILNSIFYDPD